jgi:uncharacterized membrane protein YfcA
VPSAKIALVVLLVLLGVVGAGFCAFWAVELTRRARWQAPTWYQGLVGFVANFFDTLGIGSYATTTALYRPWRVVADEKIPGTLTVGHTFPTIAQAFIFTTIIEVDMLTLWLLIGMSVLGAWLGATVVTRLPRRGVQIGMGLALLAAVGLILYKLLHGDPAAVGTSGLDGWLLGVALVGNFIIGALMTIGVGAYAPIMIMVSLLGMNPKAAFPIMMGSCAFLMPIAGVRFIRTGRYDPRASMGLALGGIPAVLLAAFVVKELPLTVVRWLVVVVVLYTSASMLWAARRAEGRQPPANPPDPADRPPT